ncbi:MAG TPA: peptidoglycan-binding protein [Candidatus Acidoferrales bacterium]|jgi:peptidoglycan hydrolase-like protein with peptidoglycan-binding domain|nr:peptidoglycan-binding protein [Candidatus Acidoferrales bacterium]
MGHPVLRLFDGSDNTSPELREEVKTLQILLNQDGSSLKVDGIFGRDTEGAVRRFQNEHGLVDDGIVGPLTWSVLLGAVSPDPTKTFLTTFPPDDVSLSAQLTKAMEFKGFIELACAQTGFQTALIGGIGSRESHWGLGLKPIGPAGTGDFAERRFPTQFRQGPMPPDGGGFGRGLMQIDFDAQEFARTGNWRDPEQNILTGCKILAGFRDLIQRKAALTGLTLLQAAVASYNSGPGNVLHAVRDGRDIDFYTAGRNYSKDVLNRAGWFQLKGWV